MIVISNTSPLNYLILLRKEHILSALFGGVVAPPAVVAELSRPEAPNDVRSWIANPPSWIQIRAPHSVDPSLDLDCGESEAIALAEEMKADRILLDEAKARRIAAARGLKVSGTLAVIFEASERGLLDFKQTINELRSTSFHLDEKLIDAILERLAHKHA